MKNILTHLLEDGWNVAVREGNTGDILERTGDSFQVISNSWRTWAADPFLFEYLGKTYIFAELFDYIKRKGSIGYCVYEHGKWSRWKTVIDEPFHMSYPNVFQHEGKIYMIPETSGDFSLRLYKAVSFPDKWKLEKVIKSGVKWVDTTFFTLDNIKYAITTDESPENQGEHLLTFDNSFNILSQKKICESNTSISRCGGNFFASKDKMIRVSQNCSERYGGSTIFSLFVQDIDILSRKGMDEILFELKPTMIQTDLPKSWKALHTYNSTEKYEVIDVERSFFNVPGIMCRLLAKLKRKRMV